MTRSQKTLLTYAAGGVVLVGGVVLLAKYFAAKASLSQIGPDNTPPVGLLDQVAATNQVLDYDSVITLGPWVIWRKSSGGETGLNVGSVVRLALIPEMSYRANTTSGVKHFLVRVTRAYKLANFTVYEGVWLEQPNGVDTTDVAFTSADVTSVVSRA